MSYQHPGVYVEERGGHPRAVVGVPTGILGVVDRFGDGPELEPVRVTSYRDFERAFGGLQAASEGSYALRLFFENGGSVARVVRIPAAAENAAPEPEAWRAGIDALGPDGPESSGLLALPGLTRLADDDVRSSLYRHAQALCCARRAFLLVDPPDEADPEALLAWSALEHLRDAHAALYCPWLELPDPLAGGTPRRIPPSGAVAGIIARTDGSAGVWKAPAGRRAGLVGATPVVAFDERASERLNPAGLNALRTLPGARAVVWGARTLAGADALGSRWKYVPVRRLASWIEACLEAGLQWVVHEPNGEPLWGQIRQQVGSFLQGLFRGGAFAGRRPQEAYTVRCDAETTPEALRRQGLCRVFVGFAPLYPAEFLTVEFRVRAGAPAD